MIEPSADLCPPGCLPGLEAYRDHGRPTGGFLRAVLENDLNEAIFRAKDVNLPMLPHIVAWVHNRLATVAWGSKQKVDLWIKAGGQEGLKVAAEATKENQS